MRKVNSKRANGITLIALVISIIVMLILAGVSLNATVGENGIITKAQNAKLAQDLAQQKEELEYMFFDYNIDDKEESISQFLTSKAHSGEIDDFQIYPSIDGNTQMVIRKGDNYFYVKEEGGYYSATTMETSLDDIQSGFTVVTEDEFKNLEDGSMVFNLEGDATSTLIFYDEVEGTFNFAINGGDVTIYIMQDMTLTNNGLSRSAIDIAEGATLNLYVYEGVTLTVDSGYGIKGADSDASSIGAAKGGEGGKAGIHVPEGAVLNVFGEGTIFAYGGNAGNGGGTSNSSKGGAGGGGAGAGIGGNGGNGGDGNSQISPLQSSYNSGQDGGDAENCGSINIHNKITVYAYAGAGGSGGVSSASSGGGGGGYPGAGIGGGGAGAGGGDHINGAGGYTGGNQEPDGLTDRNLAKIMPINGNCGNPTTITNTRGVGGGYYSSISEKNAGTCFNGKLGGGGGYTKDVGWGYTCGGDGRSCW